MAKPKRKGSNLRMSGNNEMTTLNSNISATYRRFSDEIEKAWKSGETEQYKELLRDLVAYMAEVGDAK